MATIDIKMKTYEQLQFEIMRLITDKYLLQIKIDKAIEYCENNKEFTPRLMDIIEILKGSDKE